MTSVKNAAAYQGGGRISLYEWVRLIATVFVVIGHSGYLSMYSDYGSINYEIMSGVSPVYYGSVLSFFRAMIIWIYGFHMELFFMLSGAVLAIKPLRSFDDLVRSKFRRLIVPYYLAGILFMFPLKYLGNYYTGESVISAVRVFWNGGTDSGHLWFLTALFWCMVSFAIVLKIMARFKCQSACAVLVLAEVIVICREKLPFDFLGLKMGLAYLFWFALGYYFEQLRKQYPLDRIQLYKLAGAAAVLLLAEILDQKYSYFDYFFRVLCGACFTLGIAAILSKLFGTEKIRIVFRNLFYIYLFHDPINYVILRVTFGDMQILTSSAGCWMYFMARTVGIFVLSMLLGEVLQRGINKWKSLCLARRTDGNQGGVL